MKKIIVILIMLSLTVAGVAQKTDGGANAIMQELDSKYKAFTTMKISYTYKAEKEKKMPFIRSL